MKNPEMINLDDLKKEIASFLGDDWTLGSEDHLAERQNIVLKNDHQCGFYVSLNYGTKHKLTIGGLWRKGPSGNTGLGWEETGRSISIAATKPSITIATDIKRRFLPGYLEAYQRNVTFVKEEEEYNTKRGITRERIEISLKSHRDSATFEHRCGIDVRSVEPDTVGLEFRRLRIDLAEKIIQLLSESPQ